MVTWDHNTVVIAMKRKLNNTRKKKYQDSIDIIAFRHAVVVLSPWNCEHGVLFIWCSEDVEAKYYVKLAMDYGGKFFNPRMELAGRGCAMLL